MGSFLLLSIFACAWGISLGASKEHFTAAVFESWHIPYEPTQIKEEKISASLRLYEKAAEVAGSKNADILIFSEYGVFTHIRDRTILREYLEPIPDPEKVKANPCNEKESFVDSPILVTFSCLAKKYNMFLVGNMGEIQNCEYQQSYCDAQSVNGCSEDDPCTEDIFYNADAIFDREGNLIAKYHKNHLYGEFMNTPPKPELVTFQTDFGLFGVVSCFDQVWSEAVQLVEKFGIETLVAPTHWYEAIVPLNAPEWQQGWSLGNKVNFLVADGHYPETATLGSGIYSKNHGALVYTYNPDGKNKLLIAKVPRGDALPEGKPSKYFVTEAEAVEYEDEDGSAFPEQCYEKLVGPAQHGMEFRCYKEQVVKYTLQKLEGNEGEVKACHNGFCCSATYSADNMEEYYYLAVLNGTNMIKDYFRWREESCLLVRCDPLDNKPCALFPSKAETVFKHVEMRATFTTHNVYPTVSKLNHRLAPKSEWTMEKEGSEVILKYNSESNVPLLKVALLGRCYKRDPTYVPMHKY